MKHVKHLLLLAALLLGSITASAEAIEPIDIASNADAMLYSNAPCRTSTYGDQFVGWHVLFDNDPKTIFHSDYSGLNSVDGLDHYLRVDLGAGNEISAFAFTYTTRSVQAPYTPTRIVVEGSDVANGVYEEIAILTNLPREKSTVYQSGILGNGTAYRYIRYRVTETLENGKSNGHSYFYFAEFGMMKITEGISTSGTCGDNLSWTLFEDGELVIEGTGAMDNYNSSILPSWSDYRILIRTITIQDGVMSIGDEAFSGCGSLTSIIIPQSISYVGGNAFLGCTNLSEVHIQSIEAWCKITFGNRNTQQATPLYHADKLYLNGELVTHVDIPNTITEIKRYAFKDYAHLLSVTIPNSVVSIQRYAFEDCVGLSSLIIPSTVTTIEEGAFYGCNSLASVTIPKNVTSIGSSAFYGCSSLTAINIPESVTSIGDHTFEGCSSLTDITIPESVTSIGNWTFDGCSSLTAITLPEGVTSIGYSAFHSCSSLTAINIPESVTSIKSGVFFGCSSLESITLPEGVTSIGDGAFRECSSLTDITIPESVTSIGYEAFSGCSGLSYITCNAVIPPSIIGIISGAFSGVDKSIPVYVPAQSVADYQDAEYWSEFTNIQPINSAITSLSQLNNTRLYYISLPHHKGGTFSWGVVEGGEVLQSNHQLGIAPDANDPRQQFAIVSRDGGATRYLYHVAEKKFVAKDGSLSWNPIDAIHFKNGAYENTFVAYFDNQHYVNVGGTQDMEINSWDTSDGGNSCEILPVGEFDVAELLGRFTPIVIDGVEYMMSEDGNAVITGYDATTIPEVLVIPESVTLNGNLCRVISIDGTAFKDCSSFTSITLPVGLTSIGYRAFYNCSSLIAITIPESVTSIGFSAFSGCSSLTSITIPEGVASIGGEAFWGCSSLTAITIPESVTSIGNYAFSGCSSLTSITILEGVTSIGEGAFKGCSNLTEINLPESVKSIGVYAFFDCSNLTAVHINSLEAWCNIDFFDSRANPLYYAKNLYLNGELVTELTIPNTVTAIKDYAFYQCSSLTSVTLPESVTSIGEGAFKDCTGLTSITCYAETPPACGSGAINGIYKQIPVYVPAASKTKYWYAEGWRDFANFQDIVTVTGVTLSQSSAMLFEEESLQLTAEILPENAFDLSLTWSSSDESVAIVDASGKVTTVALGTTTITATANDGSGVSASCEVTVRARPVEQCAIPMIDYIDGQVVLTCATEGVTFVSETTASGIAQRQDATFGLAAVYTITAYATKEDYFDSETVTAVLCWIECTEEHEAPSDPNNPDTGITIPSRPVLIQSCHGVITLTGLAEGTKVRVCDLAGVEVAHAVATGGKVTLSTNLAVGSTVIVYVGEQRSVKVIVR